MAFVYPEQMCDNGLCAFRSHCHTKQFAFNVQIQNVFWMDFRIG